MAERPSSPKRPLYPAAALLNNIRVAARSDSSDAETLTRMCAQCMATAAAAGGGASGLRAWMAARGFGWLTPTLLRRISLALIVVAVVVAATLSGAGS
jgi:hypothetical protein